MYSYSTTNSENNNFSVFSISSVFTNLIAPIVIFLFLYKENNPIRIAYADILKNRTYQYVIQLDERKNLLMNCKSDSCSVPSIKNPPSIIYKPSLDLSKETRNWNNKIQAIYFEVKAVKVKE